MVYLKINHDELLSKIFSDPEGAVAKQMVIPADVTCFMLRHSRRIRGIINRSDQLELSAALISAVRYIAEHDYLAYLTFIDRFDLIRELFWQKDLFTKQLAIIEEIEKEKANEKQQQDLLVAQERLTTINKQQSEKLAQEEQRKNKEKALMNLALYRYLMLQEHLINYSFHVKQIKVYEQAYEGRVTRIIRAIGIVDNDSNMSSHDKEKFKKLLKNYQKEHQKIKNIKTIKTDGSIDYKAVERKYKETKLLDEKYKHVFSSLLAEYPDNPQLQQIAIEEHEATQAYEKELVINEVEHEQELTEIRPHLENVRNVIKGDFERSMSKSVDLLKKCDQVHFSEDERIIFQNSIRKLIEYKNALGQTNDDEQVRDLSKKFAGEITRLKGIVKPPALEQESFKELAKEITFLNKMQDTFNFVSTEARNNLQRVPDPLSDIEAIPDGPPPTYGEAERMQNGIEATAMMRSHMFFHRSQQVEQQIQNTQLNRENSTDNEIIILDNEHKELLKEEIEKIPILISYIKEKNSISQEDIDLISECETLCDEINEILDGTMLPAKIKSLEEKISILKDHHNELDDLDNNLQMVIESFEISARLSI